MKTLCKYRILGMDDGLVSFCLGCRQAGRYQSVRRRMAEHCTALKHAAFAEWVAVMRDHTIREAEVCAPTWSETTSECIDYKCKI
jgi:hypothetical protein